MKAKYLKQTRNKRRKVGIRKKVIGDPQKPRFTVFRSLKHIYAQLVDDLSGRTLASASSASAKIEVGGNVEAAKAVGKDLAQKAALAGIGAVTFDRNGYRFHGRVKALADSAREAGLKF